ncbi:hypothetical protein DBR32_15495 [Taibaiella sp. KBW10]|uniref:YdeI/OmpD-associated family protein n=1 Tax=Taibaiella sp. KBW10 TaxID=2153357 RepID=UPI000F5A2953|nr:YdeI/OmpD-associated family protein [Taibaiella sp. KBW10]RQO29661.1 hypothetical protein DBR32_15495 [Taibaiella sp. KBW10]
MVNQEKPFVSICPESREAWRLWLQENHLSAQSVWLVYYKKDAGMPTLSWSEAVDEALCFGWIDSTKKTIDKKSFMQFFSRRKPNSVWSRINKEKVARLMEADLIAPAGYVSIEKAKQNGCWNIIDEVELLSIPEDLEAALKSHPEAMAFFLSLSKSVRKGMLQWVVLAKRAETRQKRIQELVVLAAQQQKPKQFR